MELPRDLWDTLLSVWRSSAGRRAPGAAGLSPDELHTVARQVRELSRGFTRDRALAGERYLGDPGLLGAYLLHFWPVSYSQTLVCLEMLRRMFLAMRSPAGPRLERALDVGAGPGPVAQALLDWGVRRVTACDRSAAALSLARKIAAARGQTLTTVPWDCTRATGMPKGPFDLICIGHTLNELWAGHPDRIALRTGLVTRLAGELAPDGRIFILEPALKSTTQEAIQVRDGLLRAGFAVELPCIWQNDCPALPEGTCHGDFQWSPPPGMVRLAHAARIGRETLKMAWFMLKRRQEAQAPAARGRHRRLTDRPRTDRPRTDRPRTDRCLPQAPAPTAACTAWYPSLCSPRAAGSATSCAGPWGGSPCPPLGRAGRRA